MIDYAIGIMEGLLHCVGQRLFAFFPVSRSKMNTLMNLIRFVAVYGQM